MYHVTECPTVYPFVYTSLLANVHCKDLLAWYEDSSFCYSADTGTSLGPLLDILLLPYVMERL